MEDLQRLLCIFAGTEYTKKGQVNDMQLKFEADNDKEYKVDGIWDNVMYIKKLAR